jgi:hypothetical protein
VMTYRWVLYDQNSAWRLSAVIALVIDVL